MVTHPFTPTLIAGLKSLASFTFHTEQSNLEKRRVTLKDANLTWYIGVVSWLCSQGAGAPG